jgi:N-acetylglutamate synthase-like GNAT family acetyltransferase
MNFVIEGPLLGQASVCIPILRLLPEWFGIEAANKNFEREINTLPTFLANTDRRTLGFLSLKQHTPFASEVYVMGIRSEAQRGGLGQELIEKAVAYTRELGIEYLQVKTLGPKQELSMKPWGFARWRSSSKSGTSTTLA